LALTATQQYGAEPPYIKRCILGRMVLGHASLPRALGNMYENLVAHFTMLTRRLILTEKEDPTQHDLCACLAAGLPHFAAGWMRSWGRCA
jgi:hypothetical protein